MKWQITLFGLLLCGFFSFFGFSLSTYAVSDITVTYTSSDSLSDWQDIFPTCTGDCLNDYHYLKIDAPASQAIYGMRFRFDGSSVVNQFSSFSFPYPVSLIINLPFDGHSYNLLQFYYPSTPSSSITYTLMEDYRSCPDPEPCPVVPDHPYDDKFDNIEKAIYVCGAILIMLYFFYCIYRMIIKGSGVN